ncbi:hypothetical protein [Bacillus phage SRT01hs]|uniref:Uncharacterized protein n=1 Tax=Bacillus phage SRT01hs TaxID=2847044 RepID=A0A6B9SWG1_9CAUD|nr:hypothetical protein H3022_gp29 [Bacillus phage SRT01hs]QHJ75881.1 hypothetical protein [Bacillus phage SRT01hs]
MVYINVLDLLNSCGKFPDPLQERFDFLLKYFSGIKEGRANIDELEMVSPMLQSLYIATNNLYNDDTITSDVWLVFNRATNEFIKEFKLFCEENKLYYGDWKWLDIEE